MQGKSPDKAAAARTKTLARLIQGNGANKAALHTSGTHCYTEACGEPQLSDIAMFHHVFMCHLIPVHCCAVTIFTVKKFGRKSVDSRDRFWAANLPRSIPTVSRLVHYCSSS